MSVMDLLIEVAPFFTLPFCILIIRCILNIALAMMKGTTGERTPHKELIEEPEKINIDKDLQKYFNYKE